MGINQINAQSPGATPPAKTPFPAGLCVAPVGAHRTEYRLDPLALTYLPTAEATGGLGGRQSNAHLTQRPTGPPDRTTPMLGQGTLHKLFRRRGAHDRISENLHRYFPIVSSESRRASPMPPLLASAATHSDSPTTIWRAPPRLPQRQVQRQTWPKLTSNPPAVWRSRRQRPAGSEDHS